MLAHPLHTVKNLPLLWTVESLFSGSCMTPFSGPGVLQVVGGQLFLIPVPEEENVLPVIHMLPGPEGMPEDKGRIRHATYPPSSLSAVGNTDDNVQSYRKKYVCMRARVCLCVGRGESGMGCEGDVHSVRIQMGN